jgi:DNA-binding Lrp family transcriptional regulator
MKALSEIDKKMLKILLSSNRRVSSLFICRTLEQPLSTVQRRRKNLERDFLEISYHLRLEKFGLRKAQILVSIDKDSAANIAKELLTFEEILEISSSMGMGDIDIRVDAIFRNNSELLDLIERVRSIKGVSDAKWVEIVKIVGKNQVPLRIFDTIPTNNDILNAKAQ